MRRTCRVNPPRSMSPLPVSRSTSAPSVGGTLSVTSPEPVSMRTERNVVMSATSTSPLPVSNDSSSPDVAGGGDVTRTRREADIARRGPQVHVPRAGLDAQRAAGAVGGYIGRRDIDADHAVHVRDERFSHAEVQRHVLALRDAHPQIGVGLEPISATSGDPHFMTLAEPTTAVVATVLVAERAVVAHAQRRIPAAPPRRHHDDVVRIDDPERFATAERPRLHFELGRVGATALDLDSHVTARAGFDAQLTDEVVDGDGIAFEDLT